jgi:hypothetical protein
MTRADSSSSGENRTAAPPAGLPGWAERDLRDIFVQLARLNVKVDTALAIRAAVDRIEDRVDALELKLARHDGGWSIGRQVFDIAMGIGMAVLAAGVWWQ